MHVEFVTATKQDKPYLLRLRKLTMVTHLETAGLYLNDEQHMARVEEAFAHSHLIKRDSQVVGLIKYCRHPDGVEIMQLQIHPDFQGKGIGSKVLQQIFTENPHQPVRLTVLKANPAFALYQRLGFVVTGEDDYEYHLSRAAGN